MSQLFEEEKDKPATTKLISADRTLEWEYDVFGRCMNYAVRRKHITESEVAEIRYNSKKYNSVVNGTMGKLVQLYQQRLSANQGLQRSRQGKGAKVKAVA